MDAFLTLHELLGDQVVPTIDRDRLLMVLHWSLEALTMTVNMLTILMKKTTLDVDQIWIPTPLRESLTRNIAILDGIQQSACGDLSFSFQKLTVSQQNTEDT